MCPAHNLDRFKGRKDDKDVLTHSLHVAYAAEDVPYATVAYEDPDLVTSHGLQELQLRCVPLTVHRASLQRAKTHHGTSWNIMEHIRTAKMVLG